MEELVIRPGERVDDLQRDGLKIIQDPERFCFGIDAVLLSDFARAKEGDKVLDLGTGTGIIPILMSAKTRAGHYTALEIQSESVEIARRSVSLNSLEDKIEIVEGDIKEAPDILPKSYYNVVTSNPPYMIDMHGLKNEADCKSIARHEVLCNLEDVVNAAAKALVPGGCFYMIHRPFRLSEILVMLTKYKLEPKRIRFIHPYVDKEPSMVLIESKRGARSGVVIEKPLVIYERPGQYTEECVRIYGATGP